MLARDAQVPVHGKDLDHVATVRAGETGWDELTSVLHQEVVEVTGMAPAEDCEHNMLVDVQWQGRRLAVPLSQLEGVAVDDATEEAINDWHYWVARGYEF